MLADFYIARFSNYMKIAVQKHNLGGLILYRSLRPSKNGVYPNFLENYFLGIFFYFYFLTFCFPILGASRVILSVFWALAILT